jgi:hypothetical protein
VLLEQSVKCAAQVIAGCPANMVALQVREQLDPQIKAAKPRWIGDITLTE